MSFDKNYPNRKDRRKPYFKKCERIGPSHRPGGDCPYCRENRMFSTKKRLFRAEELLYEN